MKTIRIAFIIGVLFFPGISVSEDLCMEISKIAETVMEKRQENTPIRTLMERLAPLNKPALKGLVQRMILEAYKRPLMRVEENKKRYVTEFGNEWYLKCNQGLK